MKWEYRLERISATRITEDLNRLGEDSWEVVSVDWFRSDGLAGRTVPTAWHNAHFGIALLKRAIPDFEILSTLEETSEDVEDDYDKECAAHKEEARQLATKAVAARDVLDTGIAFLVAADKAYGVSGPGILRFLRNQIGARLGSGSWYEGRYDDGLS